MVTKISFKNKTTDKIGIIIEPEAVNIDLEKGKSLEIELTLKTEQVDEKFECVMEEGRIIIYQCSQYEMKIYIDNELEYW